MISQERKARVLFDGDKIDGNDQKSTEDKNSIMNSSERSLRDVWVEEDPHRLNQNMFRGFDDFAGITPANHEGNAYQLDESCELNGP